MRAVFLIHGGIPEKADAFDFDLAHISSLHEDWRCAGLADAGRRTGDDTIAGFQRDRLG